MKRFIYLFQVPHELPASLEAAASADSDIVFLSWRAKSSDPRSIYYPSSSWTQGRNRLLKEVMGRPYQYFIFGDGDVQLELAPAGRRGPGDPWRAFEQFLLERQPAVGCPSYDWQLIGGAFDQSQACQTLRYFDAVLNAFHHEALPMLLPYYDLLDEASECYSQNLLCSLAADLYPGHVMQTNHVRVINTEALRGDTELLLSKPEHLYLDSRRDPNVPCAFQRQSVGLAARHPTMGPPLPKQGTYRRSDQELSDLFRLEHTLWARKRELVAMPADAEFFSGDAQTERARRWRSAKKRGAPPPPPAMPMRLWRRLRPLRLRLGLVRTGRIYGLVRALARRRRPPRGARALWRQWVRQPDFHFEIPETRQVEVLALVAAALNELRVDSVVFVDVGAGKGDVLTLLERESGLKKPVFSIGIDPVDARAHRAYSGYMSAAIASGPEGPTEFYRYSSSDCSSLKRMDPSSVSHEPSDVGTGKYFTPMLIERLEETLQVSTFRLDTLLRQFGVANEVLHFVKIDAQGSDLDVFASLGELTRNCLFLRIETVVTDGGAPARLLYEGQTTFAEDREKIEAAGFRLLNISRFGVTPEADVTFVNMNLFGELLPGLMR